jgi:hypothetical protein
MAQTVADTPVAVQPPGPDAQPDPGIIPRRGVPLGALAVLSLSPVVEAGRLPMPIGFTLARHADPPASA